MEETASTFSACSTTTSTVAVWPSLTSSGTSVKEIVTATGKVTRIEPVAKTSKNVVQYPVTI